jgi:hypothetical protein
VQEAESGIHGELRKESRDGGLVPEVKRLLEQPPMAGCGEEMSAQAKGSVSLVLLLHVHGDFLAAGSLLAGSVLFHPALGIAAVGYTVIACVTPFKGAGNRDSGAMTGWIIFAVAVISISAESFRIAHHLDLFRAHMTYQVHHKMGSPLRSKLIKPQGVILLISCLAVAMLLWRRRVQPELGTAWTFF